MIYYRQERYELAEYHFRRALAINPSSSVLHCYVGMVQRITLLPHVPRAFSLLPCASVTSDVLQTLQASGRHEEALALLERAIEIDPKNTLAKFKKASVLLSLDRNEVRRCG
jgi:anaphase-promoting complex subunit 3